MRMSLNVKASFEAISPGLLTSERVVVFAGAGTSVELGIPPYWYGDKAIYGSDITQYGFTEFEHANASLWRTHPVEQKTFYAERYNTYQNVLKNSATNFYTNLLKFLTKHDKEYFIVTSNTDNAFLHYGFDKEKVFEVHGNQTFSQCADCGILPTSGTGDCVSCGFTVRPNVLFFDDYRFDPDREREQETNYYMARDMMLDEKDMNGKSNTALLEIGVGNTVPRIRDMSTKLYYMLNRPLYHVNPDFNPGGKYTALAQYSFKKEPDFPEVWVSDTAATFGEKLVTL